MRTKAGIEAQMASAGADPIRCTPASEFLRAGLAPAIALGAFVLLSMPGFAQSQIKLPPASIPSPNPVPASASASSGSATASISDGTSAPLDLNLAATSTGAEPLNIDPADADLGNAGQNDPQSAADAALMMATTLDGAGGGISSGELLEALQGAADAGQPMALWRLGVMYEQGEGVKKDQVKAFGYFSRIANDYANSPPRALAADIVAQSFVKIGEYYREGLPDAGIKADPTRSNALLLHAATYFGDADAQYRVGEMYLQKNSSEHNVLQAARWLSLAARKGQIAAQATLGNLLFNGDGIASQPVEGLMWLVIAHDHSAGAPEQDWIDDLLNKAMSTATPDQRTAAIKAAEVLGPKFSGG